MRKQSHFNRAGLVRPGRTGRRSDRLADRVRLCHGCGDFRTAVLAHDDVLRSGPGSAGSGENRPDRTFFIQLSSDGPAAVDRGAGSQVFNIFAAAGGLFLMKVLLILDSVFSKEGKDG